MYDMRTRRRRATALAKFQARRWMGFFLFSFSSFRGALCARGKLTFAALSFLSAFGHFCRDDPCSRSHLVFPSLSLVSFVSLFLPKTQEGGWQAGICSASLLACLRSSGRFASEASIAEGRKVWCIFSLLLSLLRGQIAQCSIAGTTYSLIDMRDTSIFFFSICATEE